MRAFRQTAVVVVSAWLAACGGSPSSPLPSSNPDADREVPEVVRAFVAEAVADLELESREMWIHRDPENDGRNTFDRFGSALALLGTTAFFDGTVLDPPHLTLEAAPTICLDRSGHRLWRDLNRCRKIGRDLTTYDAVLFVAERPRDEVDGRHVIRYESDDGEATIVYRENPLSRWSVTRRPAMTASTSVAREIRVEVGGETFDLRHEGTIEIDEPGTGAVAFDLWFPVPRLSVELRVNFVSGFAATGTITKGTATVGRIGGQSRSLSFDW